LAFGGIYGAFAELGKKGNSSNGSVIEEEKYGVRRIEKWDVGVSVAMAG